ncbi:MAG: cell division protein ZapA [Myxococcota bacterium]|nr:cell division protein ZapA [Myxococcota bacterium]
MSTKSVSVRLQGRDYQIRSDADSDWLQEVAGYVDEAMNQIREKTKTIDTLDVALLTSLNLAREVIDSRATPGQPSSPSLDDGRLKSLIELVEGVAEASRGGENETPLLTLPTGDELDGLEGEFLGALEVDRPEEGGAG